MKFLLPCLSFVVLLVESVLASNVVDRSDLVYMSAAEDNGRQLRRKIGKGENESQPRTKNGKGKKGRGEKSKGKNKSDKLECIDLRPTPSPTKGKSKSVRGREKGKGKGKGKGNGGRGEATRDLRVYGGRKGSKGSTGAPTIFCIDSQEPSVSAFPSLSPAATPSASPSDSPTASPSASPSDTPTAAPSETPTSQPTPTTTNIALNKVATQSSDYFTGQFPASMAVNGVTSGPNEFSHNQDGGETNPFWRVDLGGTCTITQVVVYNRSSCCQCRFEFPSGAPCNTGVASSPGIVEFLDSSNAVVGMTGPLTETPNPLTFDIAPAVQAQHVRISLSGNSRILHMAEVEVYGFCPP